MRICDLPARCDNSHQPVLQAAEAPLKMLVCYALESEVANGRHQIKSRTETGSVLRPEGIYDLEMSDLNDMFVVWMGLPLGSFNLIMRPKSVMAVDLDGIALFEIEERDGLTP